MIGLGNWAHSPKRGELDALAACMGYVRGRDGAWWYDERKASILPSNLGVGYEMLPLWGDRWDALADLDGDTLLAILTDLDAVPHTLYTEATLRVRVAALAPTDLRPILAQWR